jgi:hypothetical protein
MKLREIEEDIAKWIYLAEDRSQWWVIVNTVMKIWVS